MSTLSQADPQSSPSVVQATQAVEDLTQAQQRQARVEQHLDRVAQIAIRSGYAGPKNAALIQFVEDRFLAAERERRTLHQLQATLQAAGVLPDACAGSEGLASTPALAEGLRILSGRLAAQQATIRELTSRNLSTLSQPGSETQGLAQALAARAAAASAAAAPQQLTAAHPSRP